MTCIVDGCGEPVKTYVRLGKVVKHVKCNDHYSLSQRGRRADETYIDKDGYVQVWHDGKRIAQHRVVMQEKLGRKLERNESVHHVNGIRTDNRPENLELWLGGIRYGQRASAIICPHCHTPYSI